MPKPPPTRWQPFTVGQHLPEAGVTVLAVMLGPSASVTHYTLEFDCCGAQYSLNHTAIVSRAAARRQACRHCGPGYGGQRGHREDQFTHFAVGDHVPAVGVTVVAVHLGADASTTSYTLVCDCGANRYTFGHKHLKRMIHDGRHRCRLCAPTAAVPAPQATAAAPGAVAAPLPRRPRQSVVQPFPLGPLPDAGVTLLAVSRDESISGEWDALRYRVRYDCCGATGELGYRVIARRAREKVQRCGACARRANGLSRSKELGGWEVGNRVEEVGNRGQEAGNRWAAVSFRRGRRSALSPARAWPRPPMLVGLPPFVWGGQP